MKVRSRDEKVTNSFCCRRVLIALPVSNLVWGKGHVPAHKEQVCHQGKVIEVGTSALADHLSHGDLFIDKATQRPPFFKGDSC